MLTDVAAQQDFIERAAGIAPPALMPSTPRA